MTELKVTAWWWQGFGKGSSKSTFVNLLRYVCHIEDTKHIPHKVPAPTYLSAFKHAGTLTCSWKSFVILNNFPSKSLLMRSPKRLRVEGAGSRSRAPRTSEEGRTIWALLGALSAPPDQSHAVRYYLALRQTRMKTSEKLPGSDAELVQSSIPPLSSAEPPPFTPAGDPTPCISSSLNISEHKVCILNP